MTSSAIRGSRPFAPHHPRTASAYIFGAICPKQGKGAALGPPRCDTEAMIVPLRAKCTELNPQENDGRFLRGDWLSNRVFKFYTDILDHCGWV
jgi:hypothetical protein